MKLGWTKETTAKVIALSAVALIGITFYFLVLNLHSIFSSFGKLFEILSPFITGFVIAYLLTRPVKAFEKFFNKFAFKKAKKQKTINRVISIVLVFILTFLILAVVVYSLVPQLIDSVATLAKNMDGYIKSLSTIITSLSARFNLDGRLFLDLLGTSSDWFKSISDYLARLLPQLVDFSVSLGSGISNFFIALIVSIYMLSSRERFASQLKKLLFAIFPERFVRKVISLSQFTNDTFGKYVSGRLLDSAIVGIVCFILMSIFNMEYALLISIIVAITNIIPFVGPFIGAIPSAFLLLMINPVQAFWFVVMIIILQQLDGNVLAPRIVGKTTGLSAFWVLFSIILGGGLFGITGVLLAVPAFSVIYSLVKNFFEEQLKKKQLPIETSKY